MTVHDNRRRTICPLANFIACVSEHFYISLALCFFTDIITGTTFNCYVCIPFSTISDKFAGISVNENSRITGSVHANPARITHNLNADIIRYILAHSSKVFQSCITHHQKGSISFRCLPNISSHVSIRYESRVIISSSS